MDICYKHIKETLDQLEGIKLFCKIITCFYETQTRNFNKDSMQEFEKTRNEIFPTFCKFRRAQSFNENSVMVVIN
jgi:hypothetical protein